MASPNGVSMEEIPLEDDERDNIEYKILMAYAQKRLSVSKYRKLLKNEANVQKSPSFIRTKVKTDYPRDKNGPIEKAAYQSGVVEQHSKKRSKRKYLPGYCLSFFCSRAEQEKPPMPPLHQEGGASSFVPEEQSEIFQEGNSQHQESETAHVNRIADKLAKLVTSRSQEPPSDVSFKIMLQSPSQDDSELTNGSEGKEHDEEKIIQTIVSLLRQSGDQLEGKIKKDRVFYQHFKDMLSYTFFKRITDLFLEAVSAGAPSEPGGKVQYTKLAFAMEVATRLTAVDNHPMNLVLGFGLKYLREHFKPWIQDQGGWEKALTSLDQEEVE
ncbi:apoptosis facilitator Bcl-2-like protein 14 [Cuculus canorus]|uniref:apoptosis facilitator Bcl-2-like protein 14 n=1 Tax=Cuculus canorus TaxID=55661 RepID=UPI0023AA2D1F|nr:apoptosis facilitator Bcl-2-like protein 14 [Cuculus canorus]